MKTETNILLFKIIFCVYYFWWLLSCFTTRLDCLIILAFTILKWNNLKKKKKVCGNNVLYFFSYSYWKSYISNFDQLGVTEIKYRVQLGSMVINNGKMYKPCTVNDNFILLIHLSFIINQKRNMATIGKFLGWSRSYTNSCPNCWMFTYFSLSKQDTTCLIFITHNFMSSPVGAGCLKIKHHINSFIIERNFQKFLCWKILFNQFTSKF